MPTEALMIGPVHLLTQNEVYAAPVRNVTFVYTGALGTLETSNDGTNFVSTTTTNSILGAFIRSSTTGTSIIFKAY